MTTHMTENEARPCIFTRACRVVPFLGALAIIALGAFFLTIGGAKAAGASVELKQAEWSFEAPFGTFDRSALGLMISVTCSSGHACRRIRSRPHLQTRMQPVHQTAARCHLIFPWL